VKAFNEAENYNGPYPPSDSELCEAKWLQGCENTRAALRRRPFASSPLVKKVDEER